MTSHDDDEFPVASYPDLKGKVVFLTGIGQSGDQAMWGNGAATARVFARNGAKIFGCDLSLEAAEHTQRRIAAEGGEVTVVSADVTNDASVKATVDQCIRKYCRIDILVNNVGKSEPGGPVEMIEKVWDDQTNVNLISVYLCCHHVVPLMEAQGSGVVVNVASIAGIRLNVVVPGLMHMPLVSILAQKYANGDLDAFTAKRNKAVPMGRMGDAFDVAMTAVWLASSQSRYVTGQKIVVDGGITSSTG